MKHRNLLILYTILLSLTAGCGDSGSRSGINTNSETAAANRTGEPATDPPVLPADSKTIAAVSNSAPANAPTALGNVAVKKVPVPNGDVPAKPSARPGPDNSEVSTNLGENLVQIRTFKDQPQLLKIEETTFLTKNNLKVTKVFLKNGQVKELPAGKIKDAMTETADNILKAVE